MYDYYLTLLLDNNFPSFLVKYLKCPSLLRLRNVGYFCGMDYASENIYDFGEYISRYDHSLDVALITYKYTKNKEATLAGLFHDIATPCFSHVIDYMNRDYETQESTEELTEEIIKNDTYLLNCLEKDNINVEDIINFKKYTIVDNNRPKLCADRMDGVILTGAFWTKNIEREDILSTLKHLVVYKNEDNEKELGFDDKIIADKLMNVSESIDVICHSDEDNYMMELLADLTRFAINNKYLNYNDLYLFDEEKIHKIFRSIKDIDFQKRYEIFKKIEMKEIPQQELPKVKKRDLNLLVNGKRVK